MAEKRNCVVFHSATKGLPSRFVECYKTSREAQDAVRRLNRTAGGGWYLNHPRSVIVGWRERGDRGDWSLAGSHRKRRRR